MATFEIRDDLLELLKLTVEDAYQTMTKIPQSLGDQYCARRLSDIRDHLNRPVEMPAEKPRPKPAAQFVATGEVAAKPPRAKPHSWTADEDAILRFWMPKTPVPWGGILELLPEHSKFSIKSRWKRLKQEDQSREPPPVEEGAAPSEGECADEAKLQQIYELQRPPAAALAAPLPKAGPTEDSAHASPIAESTAPTFTTDNDPIPPPSLSRLMAGR